jgi:hypothetical protein
MSTSFPELLISLQFRYTSLFLRPNKQADEAFLKSIYLLGREFVGA